MEQTLLTTVAVLVFLILVSLWLVLYQLVRQQGRMMLRLDHVEQHVLGAAAAGPQRGVQIGPRGVGVGKPFGEFSLPDLAGNQFSLESLRGSRVLVVNWSPQCGFCDMVAPDMAKLQGELLENNVRLLLVSASDADSNRELAEEHGLECPVLLLKEGEHLEAFDGMGTPVAYLLDEEGNVARPVAVGANEVPELLREAATKGGKKKKKKRLVGERPLSESRIEREGLKAGTPAPAFNLPDLEGRPVSLEEFRGRRVLLVFTDPHCGPCEQLAPELVDLHRKHRDNGLAVVMVGRGDAEENRRKAEEYGFEFPVVMQERWRLSKAYGIFATPVAFLIDEKGVIARNVGVGAEQILALARAA